MGLLFSQLMRIDALYISYTKFRVVLSMQAQNCQVWPKTPPRPTHLGNVKAVMYFFGVFHDASIGVLDNALFIAACVRFSSVQCDL